MELIQSERGLVQVAELQQAPQAEAWEWEVPHSANEDGWQPVAPKTRGRQWALLLLAAMLPSGREEALFECVAVAHSRAPGLSLAVMAVVHD